MSATRFPPGNEKICATDAGFEERRSSPADGCGRPGWFLVPAAVKIDTYEGNGPVISGGTVLFRVTETGSNNFMAEEVGACSGDFEFGLQWGPR